MDAISRFQHRPQPPHATLSHHRLSSKSTSALPFTCPPPISLKLSLSIRASSSNPKNPSPKFTETVTSFSFSLLKTTLIAGIASTAIFFARFNLKPHVAVSAVPPPPVSTAESVAPLSDVEKERNLEDYVSSHPDDVQALKDLMETKIKNRKVEEAIGIIERLIALEPDDVEWPLMRAHLYCYNGNMEMAKLGFNELLDKDPTRVEAYHGLVMTASEGDSGVQLQEIEKRVRAAMEMCKRANKKDDVRDFKLLLAQIRVIEGNYNEALKVYQELVKEEPRDFRPYLCQGIIYTLLRKGDEAEKQFEKYRRLVPKGHPYTQYFNDTMIATKVFGQKVENEKAASRS